MLLLWKYVSEQEYYLHREGWIQNLFPPFFLPVDQEVSRIQRNQTGPNIVP